MRFFSLYISPGKELYNFKGSLRKTALKKDLFSEFNCSYLRNGIIFICRYVCNQHEM